MQCRPGVIPCAVYIALSNAGMFRSTYACPLHWLKEHTAIAGVENGFAAQCTLRARTSVTSFVTEYDQIRTQSQVISFRMFYGLSNVGSRWF